MTYDAPITYVPAGNAVDAGVAVAAGVGVGAGVGVVDDVRVSDTGLEDIGILARETDGTAPMYLPVRVSCRVQPEPDEFINQVSVPWPMPTTPPPSVRHAPLLKLQMAKAPPEGTNSNCCQGFG
jgi:hypothetical protein